MMKLDPIKALDTIARMNPVKLLEYIYICICNILSRIICKDTSNDKEQAMVRAMGVNFAGDC